MRQSWTWQETGRQGFSTRGTEQSVCSLEGFIHHRLIGWQVRGKLDATPSDIHAHTKGERGTDKTDRNTRGVENNRKTLGRKEANSLHLTVIY